MRKDKEKALILRKTGKSYNQITTQLNIPKSTLSNWLKDVKLSPTAKQKINDRVNSTSVKALIERNKKQTVVAKEKAEKIKNNAKKEVKNFIDDKLFVAGVSLYWGEGYKKGAYGSKWKVVDFANSDPDMILLIIKFFKKYCKIENDKIKIQVIAHNNININKAINYWSKLTAISRNQFIKTSISTKISKGRKNNTLTFGTVHIRIYDVKIFFKIIGWIEGFKEHMNKI